LAAKHSPWLLLRLCTGNLRGCAGTLHGPYRQVLGIDLALWGLVYFLALLALSRAPSRWAKLTDALLVAGLLAVGILTWIQVSVLKVLCGLCLFLAGVVVGLALCRLRDHPAWLLMPLVGLALARVSLEPAPAPSHLTLSPGVRANLLTWQAGTGSGRELCLVFDYGCPHCLALIPDLERYQQRYPDDRIELLYLPRTRHNLFLTAGRMALAAERAGDFPATHRRLCQVVAAAQEPTPELLSPQARQFYLQEPPDLRPLMELEQQLHFRVLPQIYVDGTLGSFH
jgi:thiol-disulfide isomerase/thioredoxin